MKKIKNMALLGATALVGVIGFSACSSDEEVGGNNGAAAAGETVKTAFTLSVPNQVAGTRMATNEAGENQSSNFNGIQDIYLFPAITANMNTDIAANTILSLNSIHLSNFTAFDKTDLNAKVYNDVSIPVGVNHFLFYGRRIAGNDNNGELKFDFSTITTNSTPNEINFDMVPIYENSSVSAETGATEIINALNAIDVALQAGTATNIKKYATNWRALTAGSATTIAAAVSDLYASMKVLKGTNTATNTDYDAVMTAIEQYFKIDSTSYSKNGTVTATWTSSNTFPRDKKLPDGAVSVVWSSNNKFEYTGVGVVPKNNNQTVEYTAVNNYVKPAELFYFVNSPVGTAKKIILGDNSITLPSAWTNLFDANKDYTYNREAVGVDTRSVILENQIQFAVGRLELAVKVADVSGGILDHGATTQDANGQSVTGEPQVVSVPDTGYPLTGVLIGGQKNVGWDFTPKATTTEEQTIYDGTIPDGIVAKKATFSTANHTLALETEANKVVRICVEFENTGNDFYGHNGELIPAGTKFYLVAELNPQATSGVTQPSTTTTINQVFKQDYVTKVNLTIGKNSLKNAYQTIPDLRSPKLELGLSVDLTWQSGLTFTQDFQ